MPITRRAGALLVLVVLICTTTAVGSPAASADPLAEKRAEAERIARQLEQQGRQVSILAEDYDEARVRIAAVEVELADAGARVASTDAQATAVRLRLKDQAVASYVRGGSTQALSLLAETRRTEDFAIRSQYVRTLTSGAKDVLDDLRAVRLRLDVQRARLDAARAEAKAAAELAATKRREAAEAAEAQQRTLAAVEGELAVLVEAESSRRAEEEAKRAQAELAARAARAEAAARDAAARDATAREATVREAARRTSPTTSTTARATAAPAGSAPTTTIRTTTAPSTTAKATTTTTTAPAPASRTAGPPAEGADAAIAEARRQLGKPYEWGGSGPDTFDCSGLTSWAWRAGGKRLSHSSRAQFAETRRVDLADIRPGDLLFYGDPIHHVGLYIGDGQMIEAPETGKNVRIASIYRSGYTGAGRVG